MKTATFLIREDRDRSVPPIFEAPSRPFHRPKTHYRVRIETEKDVHVARRLGLPVSLLTSEASEAAGFPYSFRPRLLVARELLPTLTTSFPTIPFVDGEAARSPKLEDMIVAMLTVSTLGARRIAKENASRIDRVRLLKRVLVEGLEGRAYRVHMEDYAPGLPGVPGVVPIPRSALKHEDAREFTGVSRR